MRGHWVVRLPSWLGDTVMAVPTIRALARAGADVTLWGRADAVELLRRTALPAPGLSFRRRRGAAGVADVVAGARRLAALHPDGVLLLPNAFEPALTALLARVPRRVGYRTDARGPLLTEAIPPPPPLEPLHEGTRFARLLAAIDVAGPEPEDCMLAAPPALLARGRRLVKGLDRPLLVVPGCANGPAKRWPPESFARLLDRAHQAWRATPVLVGGEQDRPVAERVLAACRAPCVDLTGRTDLLDLAAVSTACRAAVGNDTGAVHLAAALGCPTLVLFGPTDPARTRARGPRVGIVTSGVFCQPCLARDCPLDHRCMRELSVESAFAALEPLWHAGRSSS